MTDENIADLERVQKTAVKIIRKNSYNGYKKSLMKLDMETLNVRRKTLSLKFAIKSTKNKKNETYVPSKNENAYNGNKNSRKIYGSVC